MKTVLSGVIFLLVSFGVQAQMKIAQPAAQPVEAMEAYIEVGADGNVVLSVAMHNATGRKIVAYRMVVSFLDAFGDEINLGNKETQTTLQHEDALLEAYTDHVSYTFWAPTNLAHRGLSRLRTNTATLIIHSVQVVYAG